jgi:hypothetical protein
MNIRVVREPVGQPEVFIPVSSSPRARAIFEQTLLAWEGIPVLAREVLAGEPGEGER